MNTLCKHIGGSNLYGLSIDLSDIDIRGVYLDTDPLNVFGFNEHKKNVFTKQDAVYDIVLHELTHFLRLLIKSNSQALETVFVPLSKCLILDEDFRETIIDQRYRLLNTDYLYRSLRGYIQNEKREVVGKVTGQLGTKRKDAIEKYGYSPKNMIHMFRLLYCGKTFFERGDYPVDLQDTPLHSFLMGIRQCPENYDVKYLLEQAEFEVNQFELAYKNCTRKYYPDLKYVADVLSFFYIQRKK